MLLNVYLFLATVRKLRSQRCLQRCRGPQRIASDLDTSNTSVVPIAALFVGKCSHGICVSSRAARYDSFLQLQATTKARARTRTRGVPTRVVRAPTRH